VAAHSPASSDRRAFDAEQALRAGRLNAILPADDFTPSRVDLDLPPELSGVKSG
jgi:hypothetical protein